MKYIKIFEHFTQVNLENVPEDIKDTLDEYDLFMDFDWNKKNNELGDDFFDWFDNYRNEQFQKKVKDILRKVTQDMILIKKQDIAEKKLKYFEELIKDSLGKRVMTSALSRFEEMALMDPYLTEEKLRKAFIDAKNIIDEDGSINQDKITPSENFKGDDINLPEFERFVKNNPEYKGVFDDWKKLFDESNNLMTTNLHAFRNTVSIERLRKLRNYLLKITK